MDWVRSPALHFVALGVLMFAIDRLEFSPRGESESNAPEPTLVIEAERVTALRSTWLSQTGRLPNAAETDALIWREIDDELLVREARRLGYQYSDPQVKLRLIRNMGFVLADSEDPEALLREAIELEMDRTDLVVRRRLIQKLQLRTLADERVVPTTDAELRDYLQQHALEFNAPLRVELAHVFLSRDRRPVGLDADAHELRESLLRGSIGPERATEFGDPFLHGSVFPPQAERELALKFGREFAREVVQLPEGSWQGPISSSYGKHLVWVRARHPRQPTQLEVVRGEVREALLAERGERALAELLKRLRRSQAIRIERASALPS